MKQNEVSPPCGYGLLGLCCSACLLGPCRIGPFESESAKGLCGKDRHLIVADNLFHIVTQEALQGIRYLKETITDATPDHPDRRPENRSRRQEREHIARKYGFSSTLSTKRLIHSLTEEIRNLLSFFPKRPNLLFSTLYPEKMFPIVYGVDFNPESVLNLLIDSLNGRDESLTAENILWKCLQVSFITIFSEEVRQDLQDLSGGDRRRETEPKALEGLKDLSSDPVSVLVILEGEKDRFTEMQRFSKGGTLTLSAGSIAALADIGRMLCGKWSLSLAEIDAAAVISSPSAAWTLGALALGFNVASFPALPIHGSEQVEKFFLEELKRRFGNRYVVSREGDLHDVLSRS